MTYCILTFFFFRESFNLWRSLLMITLYHQTKIPISFWYRQELNTNQFFFFLNNVSLYLYSYHTSIHICSMHHSSTTVTVAMENWTWSLSIWIWRSALSSWSLSCSCWLPSSMVSVALWFLLWVLDFLRHTN